MITAMIVENTVFTIGQLKSNLQVDFFSPNFLYVLKYIIAEIQRKE